jgi:hypothetical protein
MKIKFFKRGLIFIFISSHETAEIVDRVTNIVFGGKRKHE